MSQVRRLLSTDISCFEKTLARCWETMCDAICLTSYWPSANPGGRWTNAATWGERGGHDWRKEQTRSEWASKEQDNSSNGGLRWGHANTSILNLNDLWNRMTIEYWQKYVSDIFWVHISSRVCVRVFFSFLMLKFPLHIQEGRGGLFWWWQLPVYPPLWLDDKLSACVFKCIWTLWHNQFSLQLHWSKTFWNFIDWPFSFLDSRQAI